MEYSNNNKIYGLQEGIIYGQNERVDELNDRIKSRQFPDVGLQANFDPRPVNTKYSLFPIINRRTSGTEHIDAGMHHYVELNFNPGTHRAPPSGYINNVDVETCLRNQTVALQHGPGIGEYIPSSKSELYNVKVVSKPSNQPFPELFKQYNYDQQVHANLQNNKIGMDRLHNHTRTQLRGL